ncbi:MAG: DUF3515 family protein [Micrococcaceae bacterium]
MLAGLTLVGAGLSACTSNMVSGIETAEDATNPVCAEAMVALPETVAGFDRARTDAQSTGAWGDPAAVILRCGVAVPGPTTEHCVNANGVDWIAIEEGENWRLTSYGRDPALEVLFDGSRAASSSVMVDLAAAVERIPADRACTAQPDATQAPIPSADN